MSEVLKTLLCFALGYIVVDWLRYLSWRSKLQLSINCPFHGEKTSSLSLNLITGRYHCLGCGRKGPIDEALKEIKHAQENGNNSDP